MLVIFWGSIFSKTSYPVDFDIENTNQTKENLLSLSSVGMCVGITQIVKKNFSDELFINFYSEFAKEIFSDKKIIGKLKNVESRFVECSKIQSDILSCDKEFSPAEYAFYFNGVLLGRKFAQEKSLPEAKKTARYVCSGDISKIPKEFLKGKKEVMK